MYFDDIKIGMKRELEKTAIDKLPMIEFAKKYDNIPLHTDEEYAKNTPFKKLIAPGMYSFLEIWVKYLEVDFFGEELLAGKSTKIEWHKPVFADDVLSGVATVTNTIKRNDKNGIVEVSMEIFNQENVLVMTSVTEAVVKCKRV